jgi:hypothetical protein
MHSDTRKARDVIRLVGGEYDTLRRSCRTPSKIMRHLWGLLDLLEQTVGELERCRAASALFGMPEGTPAEQLRAVLPAGYELVRIHPAKENKP